jgi:hypothetical protein
MCTSLLTASQVIACNDSVGGIEANSILISNREMIDSFTLGSGADANEVATIVQTTTVGKFYRYEADEEIADALTTETKSVENGTLFYETVLNVMINKLSKSKNLEFRLLAAARFLTIIYQDGNGVYHAIGLDNGAKKVGGTNTAQTGKAFGDMNGYTMGFTCKEKHYPYTVLPSVVAGLTVG